MADNYFKRYLGFMSYCNTVAPGSSDATIATVLMNHLYEIDAHTLDDIAQEACISQPSVSRFIRKVGFSCFADFKGAVGKAMAMSRQYSMPTSSLSLGDLHLDDLIDEVYERSVANLEATRQTVAEGGLTSLAELIFGCGSLLLVGDKHELDVFYTLQLHLMLLEKPVVMCNIATANAALLPINSETVVTFLSVSHQWYRSEIARFAESAQGRGARTAILQQDHVPWENMDLTVAYGRPDDVNVGYHSLSLIAELLCRMAQHLL